MVRKRRAPLATKADLDEGLQGMRTQFQGLEARFDGLETRLEDQGTRLDAKIDELRVELKGDIRRVALSLAKTNENVSSISEQVRAQLAAHNASITQKLDGFTARMETIWRESIAFPKVIDEHGAALLDHAKRLSALEERRSP